MASETILLVDADKTSQKVLEVTLKKTGYRVVVTESIQEACAWLELEMPALIITDAAQPDGDGVLFCAALKRDPMRKHIPLLVLSQDRTIAQIMRITDSGAEESLAKPVYIKDVLARVEGLIARGREALEQSQKPVRQEFDGQLGPYTIIDLMQAIVAEKRTGLMILRRRMQTAAVYFSDGCLLDAVAGPMTGAEAVWRLMLWSEGYYAVSYQPGIAHPDRIQLDSAAVILEGMRRMELWSQQRQLLPGDDRVFMADGDVLALAFKQVPEAMTQTIALVDGRRPLGDVLDSSPLPDIETVQVLATLYQQGILRPVDRPLTEEDRVRMLSIAAAAWEEAVAQGPRRSPEAPPGGAVYTPQPLESETLRGEVPTLPLSSIARGDEPTTRLPAARDAQAEASEFARTSDVTERIRLPDPREVRPTDRLEAPTPAMIEGLHRATQDTERLEAPTPAMLESMNRGEQDTGRLEAPTPAMLAARANHPVAYDPLAGEPPAVEEPSPALPRRSALDGQLVSAYFRLTPRVMAISRAQAFANYVPKPRPQPEPPAIAEAADEAGAPDEAQLGDASPGEASEALQAPNSAEGAWSAALESLLAQEAQEAQKAQEAQQALEAFDALQASASPEYRPYVSGGWSRVEDPDRARHVAPDDGYDGTFGADAELPAAQDKDSVEGADGALEGADAPASFPEVSDDLMASSPASALDSWTPEHAPLTDPTPEALAPGPSDALAPAPSDALSPEAQSAMPPAAWWPAAANQSVDLSGFGGSAPADTTGELLAQAMDAPAPLESSPEAPLPYGMSAHAASSGVWVPPQMPGAGRESMMLPAIGLSLDKSASGESEAPPLAESAWAPEPVSTPESAPVDGSAAEPPQEEVESVVRLIAPPATLVDDDPPASEASANRWKVPALVAGLAALGVLAWIAAPQIGAFLGAEASPAMSREVPSAAPAPPAAPLAPAPKPVAPKPVDPLAASTEAQSLAVDGAHLTHFRATNMARLLSGAEELSLSDFTAQALGAGEAAAGEEVLPGAEPTSQALKTAPEQGAGVPWRATLSPLPEGPDANLNRQTSRLRQHLQRGESKAGLELARQLSEGFAESPTVAFLHGQAAFDHNENREAIDQFSRAENLGLRNPELYLQLATLHQLANRNEQARQYYQRFLEMQPSGSRSAEVRSILANQFETP